MFGESLNISTMPRGQEGFVKDLNKWSVLSKARTRNKLEGRGCVVMHATGKMDTVQALWVLSESKHDFQSN